MITVKSARMRLSGVTLSDDFSGSGYEQPLYQAEKRILDFCGALLLLLLLAPVLILVAVAVAVFNGGSPLFLQERVGKNGKRFRICKFRTMHSKAETILHARQDLLWEYQRCYRVSKDPRVTRLGRFLRKASLDELPMLWNVLIGDMSLVGPCPVVPQELDLLDDGKEVYLRMKPGLICPNSDWRSKGHSERSRFFAAYYREASLGYDVKAVASILGASQGSEVRNVRHVLQG